MRNLLSRSKPIAKRIEGREPSAARSFRASTKKPLQAHTDSQKGRAHRDPLFHCLPQPVLLQKRRRLKVSHSRQHNLFSASHCIWIFGRFSLRTNGSQRLYHRGQISRLVIDDRDHSRPFVLGSISPNCVSFEHATLSARANALNSASIL